MTYDELSRVRGIGRESAVKLAQRKRWRRVPGNDGEARVCVPPEWLTPAKEPAEGASPEHSPEPSPVASPDMLRLIGVLEDALAALREQQERERTVLREQIERERGRADQAEQERARLVVEIDGFRADASRLRTEAEAERVARQKAEEQLGELDQVRGKLAEAEAWQQQRPWWRRLRRRPRD